MVLRALAGLPLVSLATCGAADPPRPNIVLFTIDTLRPDHLGCYGSGRSPSPSPFIDAVAARGVRFERCFAPRGMTHPSLASMLTGKYPITHGLRDNGQPLAADQRSIASLLKQQGYRTAAFCANLDRARWDFWMRGFDVAVDGVQGQLLEEGGERSAASQRVWDERVCAAAEQWLRDLPDDGAPFFLWVHLYDVHAPYSPACADLTPYLDDPDYRGPLAAQSVAPHSDAIDSTSAPLAAMTLGELPYDAADGHRLRSLYDASIAGVDRRLAAIHAVLDSRSPPERTLLIISADHGEELGDHHRFFGHGASIYDATLRIPLVVAWPEHFPGGRGTPALAQNLDLFPTVLELLDQPIPADCEGSSLLPVLQQRGPGARGHVFAEWEDLIYAVSDGEWKLIRNPHGARPRKPPYHTAPPGVGFPLQCHELYHVARDAGETVDRFDAEPEVVRRLDNELTAFLRKKDRGAMPLPDATQDAGSLAAMRQLGYIGSTRDRDIATIPCGDER